MALKVRENVKAPVRGPGQQADNMMPFNGGTRMGKGQTDPEMVKPGVTKSTSSGATSSGARRSGRQN